MSKTILGLLCLALAGCSMFHRAGSQPITTLASEPRFHARDYKLVLAYYQLSAASDAMTFVIESDGRRWPSRHRPPTDPSPSNSLAIGLAIEESKWGSVAYIGRPCQYGQRHLRDECNPKLWTDDRYGETVISEVNRVIDDLIAATKVKRIRLIGHSGGGTVAAIVAARRTDVDCVITIAAPLDTDKWSKVMGTTRLHGSYNPSDLYDRVSGIPQDHLAGSDDRIVPPDSIATEAGKTGFQLRILSGFNHFSPWLEHWDRIRQSTCLTHVASSNETRRE